MKDLSHLEVVFFMLGVLGVLSGILRFVEAW